MSLQRNNPVTKGLESAPVSSATATLITSKMQSFEFRSILRLPACFVTCRSSRLVLNLFLIRPAVLLILIFKIDLVSKLATFPDYVTVSFGHKCTGTSHVVGADLLAHRIQYRCTGTLHVVSRVQTYWYIAVVQYTCTGTLH